MYACHSRAATDRVGRAEIEHGARDEDAGEGRWYRLAPWWLPAARSSPAQRPATMPRRARGVKPFALVWPAALNKE